MKSYQGTTTRFRIAAAVLALAIVAVMLETVTGGFLYPDPQTVVARRAALAAQAEVVARGRALADGEVKSASSDVVPGI